MNDMLGSLAGLLMEIAMLRGIDSSNCAGYAAIIGNAVGLGLYLPVIGLILTVIAGPILWVWYILLGAGSPFLGMFSGKNRQPAETRAPRTPAPA